eukprot:gene9175-9341_t
MQVESFSTRRLLHEVRDGQGSSWAEVQAYLSGFKQSQQVVAQLTWGPMQLQGPGAVSLVLHSDICRLQPSEWLNDELVNFYLTLVQYYDSSRGSRSSGGQFMRNLSRWLADDAKDKQVALPAGQLTCEVAAAGMPVQADGNSCGLFACAVCERLAAGWSTPFDFSQPLQSPQARPLPVGAASKSPQSLRHHRLLLQDPFSVPATDASNEEVDYTDEASPDDQDRALAGDVMTLEATPDQGQAAAAGPQDIASQAPADNQPRSASTGTEVAVADQDVPQIIITTDQAIPVTGPTATAQDANTPAQQAPAAGPVGQPTAASGVPSNSPAGVATQPAQVVAAFPDSSNGPGKTSATAQPEGSAAPPEDPNAVAGDPNALSQTVILVVPTGNHPASDQAPSGAGSSTTENVPGTANAIMQAVPADAGPSDAAPDVLAAEGYGDSRMGGYGDSSPEILPTSTDGSPVVLQDGPVEGQGKGVIMLVYPSEGDQPEAAEDYGPEEAALAG